MEEAAIAVVAVVALPLAMLAADLFGVCIGLGWGYYSKKRRAKRAERKLHSK